MDRRRFIRDGAAAAAAASLAAPGSAFSAPRPGTTAPPGTKFKLHYAPSLGAFTAHAGKDPLAQIRFAADEGFTAMFDNGIMNRPPAEQDAIVREIAARDMILGPFVLYADFGVESFVLDSKEIREMLLGKMRQGIETMKRTNIKQALVVPGRYNQRMGWDYQTANVVENLRACAEICEPAGLVVVLEPLNPRDHPGLFLTKMAQAFALCRAVRSPSCKILDDMYHQQITEGDLIPNIDACWTELSAFHIGDNPGRKEPTTGEINYRNVFKHIHAKGYTGALCMEHGQSKPGRDGERAVIDAYRACDEF
jgi:sugar phosphate isomerase/epimerase